MNKTTFGDLWDRLKNIDRSLNPNLDQAFDVKSLHKEQDILQRENITLTAKNTAIYLWRIPKTREQKKTSIYNKESLKRMIAEILPKVANGAKLTILDGSDVGNVIASNVDEVYLQGQEVVDFLEDIADEVEPNWSDKINVQRWSLNHSELFDGLHTSGIDSFMHIEQEPVLSDRLTSLDIFTFLCWIVQTEEGRTIAQLAEDAIPKQRKEKSDIKIDRLYALCEISCRIDDLMQGRYIQGGVWRQALYDRLLVYIVSRKFAEDTPMWRLQNHISKSAHVEKFVWFYYNDATGIQNQEKKEKQKNTRSRLRNISVITLFSLMSVLGYKWASNYYENKKIQSANEKIVEQRAADRPIIEYIEPASGLHTETNWEDLKKLVKADVEYIKKIYRIRFGSYGDMSEDQFEGKILDNLTYDALCDIHRYFTEHGKNINIFIDEKLIPNSIFSFTVANTPMQAYSWLADREWDMINTLRTGKVGTIRNDYGWYVGITGLPMSYIMLDGEEVEIIRATEDGSFAARYTGSWKIDATLTEAVIIDYFLQTRSWYRKIAEALEKYLPQSRQFDYRPEEDVQWREKDKIWFIKHFILSNVNGTQDDPLKTVRFLKGVFVDHTQWVTFAKRFERYNMFIGDMLDMDTTIINNTQAHAGYEYDPMVSDISEFDKVMTYPYVWYGNNNTLWFYTVVIKKVNGKDIYLARDASRPSKPRNAADACMVYRFLHEDI